MEHHMNERVFYHIYPLGFCGAPVNNDFVSPPGTGLRALGGHIPRLEALGITALYIGPLFESSGHGYDTLDYFHVDRRLGTNDDLKALVRAFHERGMAVALDGVFNHTGRYFFAFKDLLEKGEESAYRDWYAGLDFEKRSAWGDPFSYESWNGCLELPRLNGRSREVREHLFEAVRFWIGEFGIDGIRLDAADQLLPDFMEELAVVCKAARRDFWLMGEVIHGDYRRWACEGRLDSVTNYELYKGLWSSFNDRNFYELSWTLNRQFGPEGLYRGIALYTFGDNHDVNRLASVIKRPANLFPLYGLIFTLPGIPSVYYGGEAGFTGVRDSAGGDRALRPAWDAPPEKRPGLDGEALGQAIANFIRIRRGNVALTRGTYRRLYLSHEQFAFIRETGEEAALVAVNAAEEAARIWIDGEGLPRKARWRDLLSGEEFSARSGGLSLPLNPSWLRILV
jgi:glycosidase